MLDVKQATKQAYSHLIAILGRKAVFKARLEEVEMEDDPNTDESNWLITFSYLPEDENFIAEEEREYKIIKMNPEGEFVSMKIREV